MHGGRLLLSPYRTPGLLLLCEADHVEHGPAVLVRQEPIGTRHDGVAQPGALTDGRLGLERIEVHAHPAQCLEVCPGPLVGRLSDHEGVAERPVPLRARWSLSTYTDPFQTASSSPYRVPPAPCGSHYRSVLSYRQTTTLPRHRLGALESTVAALCVFVPARTG